MSTTESPFDSPHKTGVLVHNDRHVRPTYLKGNDFGKKQREADKVLGNIVGGGLLAAHGHNDLLLGSQGGFGNGIADKFGGSTIGGSFGNAINHGNVGYGDRHGKFDFGSGIHGRSSLGGFKSARDIHAADSFGNFGGLGGIDHQKSLLHRGPSGYGKSSNNYGSHSSYGSKSSRGGYGAYGKSAHRDSHDNYGEKTRYGFEKKSPSSYHAPATKHRGYGTSSYGKKSSSYGSSSGPHS